MVGMKYRRMKVSDFIAEGLEAEAARVPPTMKEHADILHNAAKLVRQLDNKNMIRVWEERGGMEWGSDFIKQDPTSH
jgi:hypothetical protein